MHKIGISFSLLYNISNDTNKKGLKNMPTLDYTEILQISKQNLFMTSYLTKKVKVSPITLNYLENLIPVLSVALYIRK